MTITCLGIQKMLLLVAYMSSYTLQKQDGYFNAKCFSYHVNGNLMAGEQTLRGEPTRRIATIRPI